MAVWGEEGGFPGTLATVLTNVIRGISMIYLDPLDGLCSLLTKVNPY